MPINADISSIELNSYDALFLPGGRAPEFLKTDKRVQEIVRFFMENDKPVLAICHGLLILSSSIAEKLKGRKVSSIESLE